METNNTNTDNVKITQEEIDQLLMWIKEGKTLKQIGRLINKNIKKNKDFDKTDIEEDQNKAEVKPKQRQNKIILSGDVPSIYVSIECKIKDKVVTLGSNEPLKPDVELKNAHADLYLKLLQSLDNIITLSI